MTTSACPRPPLLPHLNTRTQHTNHCVLPLLPCLPCASPLPCVLPVGNSEGAQLFKRAICTHGLAQWGPVLCYVTVGTAVPLLTGAAAAPWRPLHCRRRQCFTRSLSQDSEVRRLLTTTCDVGNGRAMGLWIAKCHTSVVRRSSRHFAF